MKAFRYDKINDTIHEVEYTKVVGDKIITTRRNRSGEYAFIDELENKYQKYFFDRMSVNRYKFQITRGK